MTRQRMPPARPLQLPVRGDSDGQISAGYVTSNGSATEGADYTFTDGHVIFANGDTLRKRFTVPIIDDGDIEGDETVRLT